MILTPDTLNYILGIIALFATGFGIWSAIKKPTEVIRDSQQDEATKALLLAQQFQQEKDSNERKFIEMNTRIEVVQALTTKDIHALDIKMESFISTQQARNEETSKNFVKLFTLLEERLPKIKT